MVIGLLIPIERNKCIVIVGRYTWNSIQKCSDNILPLRGSIPTMKWLVNEVNKLYSQSNIQLCMKTSDVILQLLPHHHSKIIQEMNIKDKILCPVSYNYMT